MMFPFSFVIQRPPDTKITTLNPRSELNEFVRDKFTILKIFPINQPIFFITEAQSLTSSNFYKGGETAQQQQ